MHSIDLTQTHAIQRKHEKLQKTWVYRREFRTGKYNKWKLNYSLNIWKKKKQNATCTSSLATRVACANWNIIVVECRMWCYIWTVATIVRDSIAIEYVIFFLFGSESIKICFFFRFAFRTCNGFVSPFFCCSRSFISSAKYAIQCLRYIVRRTQIHMWFLFKRFDYAQILRNFPFYMIRGHDCA